MNIFQATLVSLQVLVFTLLVVFLDQKGFISTGPSIIIGFILGILSWWIFMPCLGLFLNWIQKKSKNKK